MQQKKTLAIAGGLFCFSKLVLQLWIDAASKANIPG
jgi:hypothetical protein